MRLQLLQMRNTQMNSTVALTPVTISIQWVPCTRSKAFFLLSLSSVNGDRRRTAAHTQRFIFIYESCPIRFLSEAQIEASFHSSDTFSSEFEQRWSRPPSPRRMNFPSETRPKFLRHFRQGGRSSTEERAYPGSRAIRSG